jgi:hypothetical protein
MAAYGRFAHAMVHSSIWSETPTTRIVWVTMLLICDRHGFVRASVGGLARAANVPREDCLEALNVLSSPDSDDSSGVDEGRRIRPVQGGWIITNHDKYRNLERSSEGEEKERERKRKWWAENRSKPSETSAPLAQTSAVARSSAQPAHPSSKQQAASSKDLSQPDPKDLTASAREPDACAGKRPLVEDSQEIGCPADLRLTDDQKATLETGGIPGWAIDQLTTKLVGKWVAGGMGLRTTTNWRKTLSSAICSDFSDSSKRPRKPDDERLSEREQQVLERAARRGGEL